MSQHLGAGSRRRGRGTGHCFKAITCSSVLSSPGPAHTKANAVSTLKGQVNTRFTDFFLAALCLITEEVFWGGAASAEICPSLSCAKPAHWSPLSGWATIMDRKESFSPKSTAAAVPCDFTEAEEGIVDCYQEGKPDWDGLPSK